MVAVDAVSVSLCVYVNKRARAPTTKVECDLFCFPFLILRHFQRYIINANEAEGENDTEGYKERHKHSSESRWATHDNYSKLCHRLSVCVRVSVFGLLVYILIGSR